MTETIQEEWLSTREAADFLGVTSKTLRTWRDTKVIPKEAVNNVHTRYGTEKRYNLNFLKHLKESKTSSENSIRENLRGTSQETFQAKLPDTSQPKTYPSENDILLYLKDLQTSQVDDLKQNNQTLLTMNLKQQEQLVKLGSRNGLKTGLFCLF